jgi:hypothetical protein
VTQVDSAASDVRLVVDIDPALSTPVIFGPVTPDAQGVASLTATGLDPSTRYFFAVEHGGVIDTGFPGQFLTHPSVGEPASFRFGASGDAGLDPEFPGVGTLLASSRQSNHPIFDTVRGRAVAEDWLFFWHLGDMHYYDLGSGSHGIAGGASLANYRRAYEDVLLQPRQHQLYREVATGYIWDDHDYGPNDSDGTHSGKASAQQAYRERVPHHTLAQSADLYHTFQVGRVLFVVSDTRSSRSPNSDPDGPSKTMLGAAQKTWIASTLAASDAAFLIWILPSQWMGLSSDSFFGFQAERNELIGIFGDWRSRMCIVSADVHALGIDTGGASPGGIPVFQFASLDASFSTAQTHYDTGNTQPGRDQYGTVEVVDDGFELTVTGTGWVDQAVWRSHSITVGAPAPPPPPSAPSPEPVAVAKIRTRMLWLGCELVTGRKIAVLHDIRGQVSRLIGAHTSAQLTVPIPLDATGRAPLPLVLQATAPADVMIVAVVNDLPVWAGIPLPRERGSGPTMPLGCITLEGYLDRRYVGDHDFTQVDEATIAATLVGDAQVEGIGLVVDAPPTGRLRDRQYADHDDTTVYARLQELASLVDGPEWTIDLDWDSPDMLAVQKIFRLRPRLGTASTPPAAVFRTTASSVFSATGASETRYTFREDHTDGRYANHVIAVGSGEGTDRVASAPARDEVALAAGRPRWESRIRPSTSIINTAVLDDHATAELARRRNGALTWQIQARWDAYPRYGVHWVLGDDIGWRLKGHGHPAGVSGQGRAVGVEIDPDAGLLSPILLDPDSEG